MAVGVCRVQLLIGTSNSLKSKRQVLKGLMGKIRSRFNVAVAELEDQDKWQKAVLGIVTVSNDGRFVNEVLSKAVGFIEQSYLAEVLDYSIEIY
ncbi:MAG: DUF503 family protein [Anaerolineae bacterium]|nr:DUF503 family protein [Anaerolineae bacterium]NIN95079.1 DUF503 family protein [Anaerolineae bacterium]NIQ78118.1 DUF503 family protein [Anaerolineae bacterium]